MLTLENIIRKNQQDFARVIPFDPELQKVLPLDLTANNKSLDEAIYSDTDTFSTYIEDFRKKHTADYLVGGYDELRAVYSRSDLFSTNKDVDLINSPDAIKGFQVSPPAGGGDLEEAGNAEPRRLHIGTDIWGPVGTPVFAFMSAQVHGFAFNDHYGDYGATLILAHQLEDISFYTLYGHISLRDISYIKKGDYIVRGQEIAHFGDKHENGHWPPHLHFQVITDMGLYEGDYPGVCRYSEREKYLANCPDPDLVLQLHRYLSKSPYTHP
jgi:murein DD-endopeptidase MepM/ murein hydrolase activator NlpD